MLQGLLKTLRRQSLSSLSDIFKEKACGNYALNDALFSQSGNKNAVIVILIVVIFYHQSQYHGFLNAANIRLLLKFLLCGDVRGSPLRRVASANSNVLVGSCVQAHIFSSKYFLSSPDGSWTFQPLRDSLFLILFTCWACGTCLIV